MSEVVTINLGGPTKGGAPPGDSPLLRLRGRRVTIYLVSGRAVYGLLEEVHEHELALAGGAVVLRSGVAWIRPEEDMR